MDKHSLYQGNYGKFGNSDQTEDDFKGYGDNGDGYYETGQNGGKGDICRYISKQHWVNGSWRMPTADEFNKLLAEQTSVSNNGGFVDMKVTPNGANDDSGKGLNAYGYYQHKSGRWLGKGATNAAGEYSPSIGVYFPAAGMRIWDGIQNTPGACGYYWTGSTIDDTGSYNMYENASDMMVNMAQRQMGLPVRCVRE